MMKLQRPHTLVNLPDDVSLPRKDAADLIASSLRTHRELASRIEVLPTALQSLVLSTAALQLAGAQASVDSRLSSTARRSRSAAVVAEVERALEALDAHPDVMSVGLLDLGARIGGLTALLNRLNSAQKRYRFFEVQTPVPAGLVKSPQHIRAWIEQHRGKALSASEAANLQPTMVIDDFFHVARVVQEQTSVQLLVGISPTMLAQHDEEGTRWDLHAAGGVNVCVVSTYGLRSYAAEAGRPFEAAVGMLIVGQVLTWSDPQVKYHVETRGCVLDYNEDPAEIVSSIRAMTIEPSCCGFFAKKEDADAATDLMKALRKLRR